MSVPWGEGSRGVPQVNKYEQVSTDSHQMSLATKEGLGDQGSMSEGKTRVGGHCTVMSNVSWVMVTCGLQQRPPPTPWTEGRTNTLESMTFLQFRWWAITTQLPYWTYISGICLVKTIKSFAGSHGKRMYTETLWKFKCTVQWNVLLQTYLYA